MADGKWIMVDGQGFEPRHRETRVAEAFARALFVAGDRGGLRRVTRKTERLRDARGHHGRPVADREETIERSARQNRGDGRVLVVKANRDRAVLPRVVDEVTTIR